MKTLLSDSVVRAFLAKAEKLASIDQNFHACAEAYRTHGQAFSGTRAWLDWWEKYGAQLMGPNARQYTHEPIAPETQALIDEIKAIKPEEKP